MQSNYIYTVAIILLLLLVIASINTKFFVILALKDIKRNPFNMVFPSIILLSTVISSICLLFTNVDNSLHRGFFNTLPSHNTYITKIELSNISIEPTKSYSIEDFTKFETANKLNLSNVIHTVTGIATITSSDTKYNAVRVIGMDGISQSSLYGAKLIGINKIENNLSHKIEDIILVPNSDINQNQFLALKNFRGPDFINQYTLITDLNNAQKLFNVENQKFNATFAYSNINVQNNNGFYALDLQERFNSIYGNPPSLGLVFILFAIPFLYTYLWFVKSLLLYLRKYSKKYSIWKIYGISNDLSYLVTLVKFLPSLIISSFLSLFIAFVINNLMANNIQNLIFENKNFIFLNANFYLSSINIENLFQILSINFLVIMFSIYVVMMFYLSKTCKQIFNQSFNLYSDKFVFKTLKKSIPFIFLIISLFIFITGLLDHSFINLLDENAFRSLSSYIALSIFLICLYFILFKKVEVTGFRYYYFGGVLLFNIGIMFFQPINSTLNQWPYSYLLFLSIIFLLLIYFINNSLRSFWLGIIILLLVTVNLQNNIYQVLELPFFQNIKNQIQFQDPIGQKDYESIINAKYQIKDIFKNDSILVDLYEYKQQDFPERAITKTNLNSSFVTTILGITRNDFDIYNFKFKDSLKELKSSDAVKDYLLNNEDSIILGSSFNSSINSTTSPKLKVGDQLKIQISDTNVVANKKIIAILDNGILSSSIITTFDDVVFKTPNIKINTSYALNLIDSKNIPNLRNELKTDYLNIYEDIEYSKQILLSQVRSFLNLMQLSLILTLGFSLIGNYMKSKMK